MRITNSAILSRFGPRMAEISTISSKIEISNFRSNHRNFCHHHPPIAHFWGIKIMKIRKDSKFRFPKIIHVPPQISNPKNNPCLFLKESRFSLKGTPTLDLQNDKKFQVSRTRCIQIVCGQIFYPIFRK